MVSSLNYAEFYVMNDPLGNQALRLDFGTEMEWPGGIKPEPVTAVSTNLQNAPTGALGMVVGRYKTAVTTPINKLRHAKGTAVWHRGNYERIICNEQELNAIRQYILNNPARWVENRDNLDELTRKMTYHP